MSHKKSYRSLRPILLASMILVPIIPFVLIMGIGYSHFASAVDSHTVSAMRRIVEDHRHMIESFLAERKADLDLVARSYTFDRLTWPRTMKEVFQHLQEGSQAFVDLGVFTEAGVHMAYHGPYQLTGKVYRDTPWFQEVMKRGCHVSDIFMGFRHVPHFVIAVVGEDDGRKWVLRATIDSNLFNDLVKKVRIGQTGEAYLLDRTGRFQTERRSGGELMTPDTEFMEHLHPHEGIRTFIAADSSGVEVLYATTWLRDKDWILVVRQEKADAYKDLRKAAFLIILITVVGGSGIVLTAFFLTDRIVRRMEQMDSEKDRLGEQLIRATRLAELGEMAAGFAHEINNPLQIMKSEQALMDAIMGDLQERGDLPDSPDMDDLRDSMRQIGLQIDRCGGITQAILKFGRQSEPSKRNVDPGVFLPEAVAMVDKKASVNGIALETDVTPDLPAVYADPGQLQQVLVNLLNNAMDAVIAQHGPRGGAISINARPTENGKVCIAVRDNGCGIRSEDLEKVFRPFFTTKPVGKGTGLGLSVCYGIVDGMGGTMSVESEPGKGTVFTIVLPAAEQPGGGHNEK